jgi:hypothetical protein
MIRLQVKTSSGALVYEKKRLKRIMRAAGSEVAAVARSLIRRKVAERKKGGIVGSAPGEPPAVRTGALLRGIVVRPYKTGEGVAIRDKQFYALFLEAGAKGGGSQGGKGVRNRRGKPMTARVLLPRPFLSTALESRQQSIGTRIRDSIAQDIAFRRVKA